VEDSKQTNGYLPNSYWETLIEKYKDAKRAPVIEGTTIDNLPVNKLHWGCRHSFTPVIKKTSNEEQIQ